MFEEDDNLVCESRIAVKVLENNDCMFILDYLDDCDVQLNEKRSKTIKGFACINRISETHQELVCHDLYLFEAFHEK